MRIKGCTFNARVPCFRDHAFGKSSYENGPLKLVIRPLPHETRKRPCNPSSIY